MDSHFSLAPEAGFEPATIALTGHCSTVELLWNGINGDIRPEADFSLCRIRQLAGLRAALFP